MGQYTAWKDHNPQRNVTVDGLATRFVWSEQGRAWICQTCGNCIGDYQKHGAWHSLLANALLGRPSPLTGPFPELSPTLNPPGAPVPAEGPPAGQGSQAHGDGVAGGDDVDVEDGA